MLRDITDNVFALERPDFRLLGANVGGRMVGVRLPQGEVVLYSPVRLTDEEAEAVRARGNVTAIVAPNKYHHLYVADAQDRFPEAAALFAPGLEKKRSDLDWSGPLTEADGPWGEDLVPHFVGGFPAINEFVLVHRPSRTLIVADLLFNLRAARGLATRIYVRAFADLGPSQSKLWRLAVRDHNAARASIERLLNEDFDRVVMCHGEVIDSGGREALERTCGWLFKS